MKMDINELKNDTKTLKPLTSIMGFIYEYKIVLALIIEFPTGK